MATVLPLLAGAGLLLAACSGGSSSAGSTTSTTAAGATGSFQAYLTCLRSHGVNFPTGGGGTPGSFTPGSSTPGATRPSVPASERGAFEKAATACASLRPKGGGFTGGGQSTAFAAYRNCLKLHGVTLPSGPGGGGFFGGGGSSTTTSTTNPKLEAAEAACATLRPKGGFGRAPGATTTTS